ncbi:MAG: hypothetical protein FJZ01_02735 [Candidatus Sericytochromatia bacterium]|nr:hypothetical protein [Candidatus Tanganyikabacteria bacterium]
MAGRLPLLAPVFVLALSGCVANLLQPTYTGCSPQIPREYTTLAIIPVGRLEIAVKNAAGEPLASKSVYASWRGQQRTVMCAAGVFAATDAAGKAVLERMRVGEYYVNLVESEAFASGQVAEGETTRIVLTDTSAKR